MTDDIGHESFPLHRYSGTSGSHFSPSVGPQSTVYCHILHPLQRLHPLRPLDTQLYHHLAMPSPIFPRERTVHTVYFKIWDPDSPARSLYVEEINQQGIVRQFDPEHFFHKLTGDHIQANQMSDYWRSHYGLPLKHGGTPFQPTSEQVAGLASARLLRHGLVGDREHVAEPVAGLAPLHGFSARFIWRS